MSACSKRICAFHEDAEGLKEESEGAATEQGESLAPAQIP